MNYYGGGRDTYLPSQLVDLREFVVLAWQVVNLQIDTVTSVLVGFEMEEAGDSGKYGLAVYSKNRTDWIPQTWHLDATHSMPMQRFKARPSNRDVRTLIGSGLEPEPELIMPVGRRWFLFGDSGRYVWEGSVIELIAAGVCEDNWKSFIGEPPIEDLPKP